MPSTLKLLAVALAALSATAAMAADGAMTVQLKESHRIVLSGPAANIVIGDPSVADVAMLDNHSVIVMGKGYGSTDILVLDRAGHTLLDSEVTVVAPNAGRVTVYRGASPTEFSCAAHCQALASSDSQASASQPASDAGGGSSAPAAAATAP
jgi:Flp pilus assembly secretin CpaC